jgi:uncharacterized RDD family membrane protein YckC
MTRNERLAYCKVCQNRKFDFKEGIICKLTDKQADFEVSCNNYLLDQNARENIYMEKRNVIHNTVNGGTRLLNYILDLVAYYIIALILGFILGATGSYYLIEGMNDTVLGLMIITSYYIFFEAVFGQTIGKMITKTKVVTANGEKPSFLNITGRTLCRFIPFEAFSFLGSDAVGWHDSISNTRVIKVTEKVYQADGILDSNLVS